MEDFWRITEVERKGILADKGIFGYFQRFPALRIQEGYRLVSVCCMDINIVCCTDINIAVEAR